MNWPGHHPDDRARLERCQASGRFSEAQLQTLVDNLADARRTPGSVYGQRRR